MATQLYDAICEIREIRQRVLVVEKLLLLCEEIQLKGLQSKYGIPSYWILDALNTYIEEYPENAMYHSIPNEIVQSLTLNREGRVTERHIKEILQDRYNKFKEIQ